MKLKKFENALIMLMHLFGDATKIVAMFMSRKAMTWKAPYTHDESAKIVYERIGPYLNRENLEMILTEKNFDKIKEILRKNLPNIKKQYSLLLTITDDLTDIRVVVHTKTDNHKVYDAHFSNVKPEDIINFITKFFKDGSANSTATE